MFIIGAGSLLGLNIPVINLTKKGTKWYQLVCKGYSLGKCKQISMHKVGRCNLALGLGGLI